MTSVLESKYVEATRPYSQDELKHMRQKLYRKLRLGKTVARHQQQCDHFYLVKQNGRKEKEMHENKNVGNCSVCWKLGKTPNHLRNRARNLVCAYSDTFLQEPTLTYTNVDMETAYYSWLYEDFNN